MHCTDKKTAIHSAQKQTNHKAEVLCLILVIYIQCYFPYTILFVGVFWVYNLYLHYFKFMFKRFVKRELEESKSCVMYHMAVMLE